MSSRTFWVMGMPSVKRIFSVRLRFAGDKDLIDSGGFFESFYAISPGIHPGFEFYCRLECVNAPGTEEMAGPFSWFCSWPAAVPTQAWGNPAGVYFITYVSARAKNRKN